MNATANKKTYNLELTNKELKFVLEGLVSYFIELNSGRNYNRPESKKSQEIGYMVDQINILLEGKPYY